MRCACIDIGSNTTRALVADVVGQRLEEVVTTRAYTRLGRELRATGALPPDAIELVADVVAHQSTLAERTGAERLQVVATAAIRGSANGAELCRAVSERAGLEVMVLSGAEEARLAFAGAVHTRSRVPDGTVAVVDVGGGSTEIAAGRHHVEWTASLPVGSGLLADAFSDPPAQDELEAARAQARAALEGVTPPLVDFAIAVGGSATSTARMVGPAIDGPAVEHALVLLCAAPAADVARRHGLVEDRARLLPAGLVILEAASAVLGLPLEVGSGGLREGVCFELASRVDD